MEGIRHQPVLLAEVLGSLAPVAGGLLVDGTLGEGGHSQALLERDPAARVIGFDQDPEILAIARKRLAGFGERFTGVLANFRTLGERIAAMVPGGKVDGILLDLGISSFHYEGSGRGFSFRMDEPLDMRLSPDRPETAADLVMRLPVEELAVLIARYGEERWAMRIAREIGRMRAVAPITGSRQLAEIVAAAVPRAKWPPRTHPATRTFQALRIAVNHELEVLEEVLPQLPDLLHPGGRLCVISFHSLEDRLVKNFLRAEEPQCRCAAQQMRCVCGRPGRLEPVTRKPVTAGADEMEENPRARSARLRAATRTGEP